MKKIIKELSLLPNLGLGATQGTTGPTRTTSTDVNKPGSKTQNIAKTTNILTKQINDIANKIASAKEKATQSSQPDQQKLLQTVALLQKQLEAMMTSENEESKSSNYKKRPGRSINNNTHKHMLKTNKVQEGLIPAIGKSVKDVTKTTGNIAGLAPIVGGPVKAVADIAGDTVTTVTGGKDENEETNDNLTPIQDNVVSTLARKKYRVNKVSYEFANEEGGPTVYMSKRPNKYSTRYAEVSPDGSVNGMSIKEFLGSEENEERVLTKRPMHEKTSIDTFLKAIMQKNYSGADKYLSSLVNEKIKKVINKAIDK